jgi:hypothetical protein
MKSSSLAMVVSVLMAVPPESQDCVSESAPEISDYSSEGASGWSAARSMPTRWVRYQSGTKRRPDSTAAAHVPGTRSKESGEPASLMLRWAYRPSSTTVASLAVVRSPLA